MHACVNTCLCVCVCVCVCGLSDDPHVVNSAQNWMVRTLDIR